MSIVDELNKRGVGTLPGLIGLEIMEAEEGADLRPPRPSRRAHGPERLPARRDGRRPRRHLLRLRDLREPARRRGGLHHHRAQDQLRRHQTRRRDRLRAELAHGGRTTQVWDAEVADEESGKPIALFRCTQLILYPR